jgi:hypothetical protein
VQKPSDGATICSRSPSAKQSVALLVVALHFLSISTLHAQEGKPLLLQVDGPRFIGPRTTLTEGWSALQYDLRNLDTTGRDTRVSVFYSGQQEVQYAREVWVPARALLQSWLTIGPAPKQASDVGRKLEVVLCERVDGEYRPVLPAESERVRSATLIYRKREPTTSLYADLSLPETGNGDRGDLLADLVTFARIPRYTVALSDHVSIVRNGNLPPTQETFDAVDVFILAGNRLAHDLPGRAALRRWVLEGGCLWVMLDCVDLEVIAPILGDHSDLAIVDRIGLTTTKLDGPPREMIIQPVQEHEQPVSFVRVFPSATDQVLASVDGWPAAFTRPLGRGKVVFTTLGARGWTRPRVRSDPASLFKDLRDFPVPLSPATNLARELHPQPEPDPLSPEIFRPMLVEEIGYTVVGRGTAAFILGGFVLILVGLGVAPRRIRMAPLVGWFAPGSAVITALLFVGLGVRSRCAAPPTVGIAGIVDPISGTGDVVISGTFAVYHPGSGPITSGTKEGATLGLDTEGLDGQMRRRLQTDTDCWHWDELSLPAGVRTGFFRTTQKAKVFAAARFGPDGVEGKLDPGPFKDPADLIIANHGRDPLAVRIKPDGSFQCGAEEVLPSGQFLTGTVLTERQLQRQAVYKHFFSGKRPRYLEERDLLLAWTEPSDLPLLVEEGAKVVGALLLAVPLEFERTPADTPVTIPRGFVSVRRLVIDKPSPVTMGAFFPVDMELRFQLPVSVLPLRVDRATLFAQVSTPSRRFSVYGKGKDTTVSLFQAAAPTDAIRIDITDPAILKVDDRGGLHVHVAVGEAGGGAAIDTPWKIESLALEVVGRTGSAR